MAMVIYYLMVYGFLGFLLEVLYARLTHRGNHERKCLLLLPLCPVYGVGGLLLTPLVGAHPLVILLMGGLITTGVELVFGWFYRYILGVTFWDYQEERFHFHGLVCLKFSLCWSVLSLFFVYKVHPLVEMTISKFPSEWAAPLAILLISDSLISCIALYHRKSIQVLRWYR